MWAFFAFPKAHSIWIHFINYLFFLPIFFLWKNFFFRSQKHLRYKIEWSQKPDYFQSFSLLYYPQSTIKENIPPFTFSAYQFSVQWKVWCWGLFSLLRVFHFRCLCYKNNLIYVFSFELIEVSLFPRYKIGSKNYLIYFFYYFFNLLYFIGGPVLRMS